MCTALCAVEPTAYVRAGRRAYLFLCFLLLSYPYWASSVAHEGKIAIDFAWGVLYNWDMTKLPNDLLNKPLFAKFLYSPLYLAMIAFVVLLGWTFDQTIVVIGIMCGLFCFVAIASRDTTPLIPLIFGFYFSFTTEYGTLQGHEWMFFLILIPLSGIVAHCIFYRPRLRIRGFGIAMAFTTLPWVLQGLGRRIAYSIQSTLPAAYIWVSYLVVAGIGLLYLLFYLFFDATCSCKSGDLLSYMLRIMLFAAGIIVVQNIINVGRLMAAGKGLYTIFVDKWIHLGWGIHNQVASFYSLTIPITFYFALKWKRWGFLALAFAFVQYALLLLTYARGPLVFVTLALPVMVVYLFVRSEPKARIGHGVVLAVAVAAVAAICVLKRAELADAIGKVLDKGLGNNGRFAIYRDAWRTFLHYPVVGGGMDVYYYTDALKEQLGGVLPYGELANPRAGIMYHFHSTFFQIIAAFGILGLVAYLYQFLYRYAIVARGSRRSPAKLAVLAAMILFDLYGLIDTCFFSAVMHFVVMLLTLCIDKDEGYVPPRFLPVWLPKWLRYREKALEPDDLA